MKWLVPPFVFYCRWLKIQIASHGFWAFHHPMGFRPWVLDGGNEPFPSPNLKSSRFVWTQLQQTVLLMSSMNVTRKLSCIPNFRSHSSNPDSACTCGRWVDLSTWDEKIDVEILPCGHVFSRWLFSLVGGRGLQKGPGVLGRFLSSSDALESIQKLDLSQVACLHPLHQFLNLFFFPNLLSLPYQTFSESYFHAKLDISFGKSLLQCSFNGMLSPPGGAILTCDSVGSHSLRESSTRSIGWLITPETYLTWTPKFPIVKGNSKLQTMILGLVL